MWVLLEVLVCRSVFFYVQFVLCSLKYEINDLLSCSAWTERREWWSRFYFNLEQVAIKN